MAVPLCSSTVCPLYVEPAVMIVWWSQLGGLVELKPSWPAQKLRVPDPACGMYRSICACPDGRVKVGFCGPTFGLTRTVPPGASGSATETAPELVPVVA